jgi:hypothetical protein
MILFALTSSKNKPYVALLCDWNFGITVPIRRLIAHYVEQSLGKGSATDSEDTLPPPLNPSGFDIASLPAVRPLDIRSAPLPESERTGIGDLPAQYQGSENLDRAQSGAAVVRENSTIIDIDPVTLPPLKTQSVGLIFIPFRIIQKSTPANTPLAAALRLLCCLGERPFIMSIAIPSSESR